MYRVCYRHGRDEAEKGGVGMFERFTDKARRVVVLAQEEARMLNHDYIGTEHILLGPIRGADGPAAQVLLGLGADLDLPSLSDEVERLRDLLRQHGIEPHNGAA
jgi:ATP-dependent Clp protease ATP-binding subunit ClpC